MRAQHLMVSKEEARILVGGTKKTGGLTRRATTLTKRESVHVVQSLVAKGWADYVRASVANKDVVLAPNMVGKQCMQAIFNLCQSVICRGKEAERAATS